MVFQAAYDTYPLDTRAWKRNTLADCAQRQVPLFFSHDPDIFGGQIRADEHAEFVMGTSLPCPAKS
jgi:hypothetical protein